MKKVKKRKIFRGFTLVEVMTSLVIMTILITIASGVIITTFNIFARNTMFRVAQNEGNNVYSFLYDHISCASSLKIGTSADINYKGTDSDTWNTLLTGFGDIVDAETDEYGTVSPDKITQYYEGVEIKSSHKSVNLLRKDINTCFDIFGDTSAEPSTPSAMDCFVSFETYNLGDSVVKCTVEIKRDDEVYYTKSGSIPLYNINHGLENRIFVTECSNENSDLKIIYTYLQ